jgi:hypothetical protein
MKNEEIIEKGKKHHFLSAIVPLEDALWHFDFICPLLESIPHLIT